MRRFSGAGGSLYALGERLSFGTGLYDCGDGWDFYAPEELSYWLEEPEIYASGEKIAPVECYLTTGRIGVPRNMSHGVVCASGLCRPLSLLSNGECWEVVVEAVVPDTPTLGDDHIRTTAVVGRTTGILYGTEVPIQEVLARFPLGSGMLVGIGEATQMESDVHINFKEGVQYARRQNRG